MMFLSWYQGGSFTWQYFVILELQKKCPSVFVVLLSIGFAFLWNTIRINMLAKHVENVCEMVQNEFRVKSLS